jgi:hypothetical protein
MQLPIPSFVRNFIDRSNGINGEPFDPAKTSMIPQHGKYTTVHYGIMIPNLPEPFRFLNLLTVLGQPRIKLWRNEHLIKTTARDTANLLVGTGVATPEHFSGYSIEKDCDIRPDASFLRFGSDLTIAGTYPNFTATRVGKDFNLEITLRATDKVAHFTHVIGELYDHWAILCEYEGILEYQQQQTPIQGLCTFEYARGADINLPFQFFTYQIININAHTQALFVEVLGPLSSLLQRRVYIRSLTDHGAIYEKHVQFTVHELEAEIKVTPDGAQMKMPKRFSWQVHYDGREILVIDAHGNNDFCYGMAAGYAGSYQYTGRFQGADIKGMGYIEYMGRR